MLAVSYSWQFICSVSCHCFLDGSTTHSVVTLDRSPFVLQTVYLRLNALHRHPVTWIWDLARLRRVSIMNPRSRKNPACQYRVSEITLTLGLASNKSIVKKKKKKRVLCSFFQLSVRWGGAPRMSRQQWMSAWGLWGVIPWGRDKSWSSCLGWIKPHIFARKSLILWYRLKLLKTINSAVLFSRRSVVTVVNPNRLLCNVNTLDEGRK